MVSTARNFGPQLIAAFGKQFPSVEVEIDISNREGVIAKLQRDEADVAIMGRPPGRMDVDAYKFAKHPYVLISHPDYPLQLDRKLRPVDLLPCRFLVREPGSGTRMVHEHFFVDAGLSLPKAQEMDSNANIKQSVMANLAVAFISAHTVKLECDAGKLRVLDVEGMPQLRDWFVVAPVKQKVVPPAKDFVEFVRREGPAIMLELFGDVFEA